MRPLRHLVVRVCGAAAAAAVLDLLDAEAAAVSAFEAAPDAWLIEGYSEAPLLTAELGARLALVAAASGGIVAELEEERLPARNWLAENQAAFPPLRHGRFFIYGGHYRGAVPAGAVAILVDAAAAFGTGEHPSTRGCLAALESLVRRHRFRHPLDIGTGTGILSVAAAKLLHRSVLASDIDPAAVAIARTNAQRNGVARRVRVTRAAGYPRRGLARGRYDLVLSNILARPLALMAGDLRRALAPGGRAVLSGLLRRQEPILLWPHRGRGLVLERRLVIEGWSTLVLKRSG